ncbi:MAG: hypothetical protein Q4F26_06245 [Atopococcus tabaci]|uniref:Polysaccharide pyruvyl transferase domain-containing protein n=1 Tax=Atopococcus tabaci TaxID=269774 RepID=A0AA43UDI1_9LACT|nr:hypothetical protein [Atopococcus tabaci]
MADYAPISITNHFTHSEKNTDDLFLGGKVCSALGLVTEAYLLLSDKKNNLFFIRPIDFNIDFEVDESIYAFNYSNGLDLDQISNEIVKQGVFETQLEIELRIQFKGQKTPSIVALTHSKSSNNKHLDKIIKKKRGEKVLYFSFNVDEEGFIFLTINCYAKETATFLQERTSILKFSHPLLLNKNIWMIGGHSPQLESFNTWSFFEFLQKEHTEIKSYYTLSEDAPHYKDALEQYGDAILPYKSKDYMTTLIRSTVLITSGCPQLFYPVNSMAYHHRLKAKKVLLPGSILGVSSHIHTFNQSSGQTPVDFIITHCEEEAEFVNLRMGYEGDRILIAGSSLADRFLDQDMEITEKHSTLMLPHQLRDPVKSNTFSTAAHYLSLVKSKFFKDFIKRYELNPIIALSSSEFSRFENDFINENITTLAQTESNILDSFYHSMLVISNNHPMVTTFALSGRPIIAYEPWDIDSRQFFERESLPLGERRHTQKDLLTLLDETAETGFLSEMSHQLPPEKLIEFRDSQSNHRIFEILVEQL